MDKLDGTDVTSGFTAESATTWSYRPAFLSNDDHIFEVIGRDDAGNTHGAIVRSFSVNAPEPTATPVPTETPTPLPTVDITPVVEVAPTEVPTDATEVASASPEPVGTPDDSTPVEATPAPEAVEPEPVATPVPEAVEPTAVPEDAASVDAEPEVAPTPEDSEAVTPEDETEPPADDGSEEGSSEEDEEVTEEDIAATVAAMRADDEDNPFAEDEGNGDGSLAPEPALTVFGCNVPTGGDEAVGAVTAGADYLLAAAGLFGLIVARVRPKRRKNED